MVKPSVVQKHVEDRDATAVAEAVGGLYHCWICHKHSGVAVWLADSVSTSWGGGGATDYIWPCGGYKGESSTGMLHRTHKRLKYGMIDGLESDHKKLEALHLFFLRSWQPMVLRTDLQKHLIGSERLETSLQHMRN